MTMNKTLAGHGIYLGLFVEDVSINDCRLKAVLTQGIQIEGGKNHKINNVLMEGKTGGGITGSGIACSGELCTFTNRDIPPSIV